MKQTNRRQNSGLWSEFQSVFLEFSGVSVQTFDEKGSVVRPSPALPSLCAYLERHPELAAACQKDCFRKAATCRTSRQTLAARCYAGLSYRIVPIRKRNQPHAVILVGRVLTEVVGSDQFLGLIEKHKLSRQTFLEHLAAVRSVGSQELDRAAAFVRRVATANLAAGIRFQHRHAMLEQRRSLIDFARQATAFHERSPGRSRELLEAIGRMISVPAAALLCAGDDARRLEVRASVGLGEEVLHKLSHQNWQRTFDLFGQHSQLDLSSRDKLLKAGLDLADSRLTVQRLAFGRDTVGYLVVAGAELARGDCEQLESASDFIAARVVHELGRERTAQRDEEARLLALLAERCLTARTVEELLPLALDSAMHGLRARRGSILLAEQQGRIVARELRGAHAPIGATIDALAPDSISHRVFFDRRPLLVQDIDQEPGLRRERQFPYASRSFVSVPLRENGHTLGVLHLSEREGEEAFTPRDLWLLERLSLQATAAIRKVRLEEEVQELRVSSTTDHLTGVYNRRFLEERLAAEFQRARRFGQPLAVAMIDLDGFKALNDAWGHSCGDRVLQETAAAIRRQLRSVDIVARYGGDEFVLVLPGTDARGAMRTAEKVRARIETTDAAGVLPGSGSRERSALSASVGLSVYADGVSGAEELLQRADQALFQAKQSGRNATQLWDG